MPGGLGGNDIWKVDVSEGDVYGTPVNLGSKINTEGNEQFPSITDDNLLYFSSDSRQGLGGLDIYVINLNKSENALNLGKPVNSEKDDFSFSFNTKRNLGFFSSNREKTTGNFPFKDGYVSDVFVSQYRGKSFTKAKGMGGMYNTEDVDDFAGGSADGSTIFLTSDKEFQIFNLYLSQKGPKARSFPKPIPLDGINGKNTNEMSATINDDQNLIIFSSDRPGGYGGQDLYISRLLHDGTWSAAVNMGPQVNSERDDIYPMFTPNQKGIIFSSNNNYSMGGFDLFQTDFSEELKTWTAPKNLGYPINSPFDDLFISKLPNNKYAYKDASRKDSYGMKDLYRLTFLDSTPIFTVIAGAIVKNDTVAQKENALKLQYTQLKLSLIHI